MKTKQKSLYTVCECAVFIALAVALSFFEIKIGVFGGSIDFTMIPLFILCYRHGAKYGFLSCFVFSLVYVVAGGKASWGLLGVLLDYILAYTVLGVASLFAGKKAFVEVSVLVACLARFCIHFVTGITLWAITTESTAMGITTSNVYLYSLLYNIAYMLPNTVIAVVAMSLLRIPLQKLQSRGALHLNTK